MPLEEMVVLTGGLTCLRPHGLDPCLAEAEKGQLSKDRGNRNS